MVPKPIPAPKVGRIDIVNVPSRLILSIDGHGKPPEGDFQDAMGVLYPVSFTAKFDAKARGLESPKVQMIEILYDMGPSMTEWNWTLIIEQMPPLDARSVKRAITLANAKKPNALFARLEVRRWREGLCAQTLHVGPYDQLGRVHMWQAEQLTALGYRPNGLPHEIYLNDPNRLPPEKLKTIVRIPITKL